MTRLTNQIRNNIVIELTHRRFKDEGVALAMRSAELFKLVYEDQYDLETRRLIERLKKRHRHAFITKSAIDVSACGFSIQVGKVKIGAEGVVFEPTIDPKPFLYNSNSRINYGDCTIGTQIRDYATDTEAFKVAIRNSKAKALGALSSLTTAKQMAENWPEIVPIAQRHMPVDSGSNLPAVKFKELSDFYGLVEAEAGQ